MICSSNHRYSNTCSKTWNRATITTRTSQSTIHPREELTRHAHARLLETRTHARTPRENDARAFSRFYWRHAANLVSVREDERTVKGGAERRRNATNFRAARRVYTIVQGYQPSSECMGIRENVLPRSVLTDRLKL